MPDPTRLTNPQTRGVGKLQPPPPMSGFSHASPVARCSVAGPIPIAIGGNYVFAARQWRVGRFVSQVAVTYPRISLRCLGVGGEWQMIKNRPEMGAHQPHNPICSDVDYRVFTPPTLDRLTTFLSLFLRFFLFFFARQKTPLAQSPWALVRGKRC
jgi:hypothetical protein